MARAGMVSAVGVGVKRNFIWRLPRGRERGICPIVGLRTNSRYLEGKERGCPVPRGHGEMQDLTRWMIIRDGLESIIETLPSAEHSAAARLQEAWATASRRVEDLSRNGVPEWVLPLGA